MKNTAAIYFCLPLLTSISYAMEQEKIGDLPQAPTQRPPEELFRTECGFITARGWELFYGSSPYSEYSRQLQREFEEKRFSFWHDEEDTKDQ